VALQERLDRHVEPILGYQNRSVAALRARQSPRCTSLAPAAAWFNRAFSASSILRFDATG
jgi:hypothetical protein